MSELDLGSLSEQVAARARARAQRRATVLTIPVPGFEDLFVVQYRRLTFAEKAEIVARQGGDVTGRASVDAAADMLVNACEDILQVTGPNAYQSLDTKWTSGFVSKLFQIDDVGSARDALIEAFDDDDLIAHFNAYLREVNDLDREVVEGLPGESKPSAEG